MYRAPTGSIALLVLPLNFVNVADEGLTFGRSLSKCMVGGELPGFAVYTELGVVEVDLEGVAGWSGRFGWWSGCAWEAGLTGG
jgi:hypothetical protein